MATNAGNISLAYLIGHYPGVSLTFILREVRLLRQMGFDIRPASVNHPQPSQDGFTEAEEEEYRRTFYVKARGPARILSDHLACLLSRPLSWFGGLMFALRLGGLEPRTLLYHLFYFGEAVVVGQWMQREGLRHVHVHFANNTATLALITSRMFPVTYSVSVHGPNEFYGVREYRLKEKVEGASFLACIGQYCRSQLMRFSAPEQWPKFYIVPLGVDPETFTPRQQLTGTGTILCVGRLVPEKGQLILVVAVAKLVARGIAVRLELAGDGPSRPALEQLVQTLGISESVVFHGSVNQNRLLTLLKEAEVFALPSFAEGIPVALMEAMAMEIPCVSTFIAGIPELIESGKDGVLVPPSDADLLALALEKLLLDQEWRTRIGQAGRRKVIDRYNLRPNVEHLGRIFTRHLGNH